MQTLGCGDDMKYNLKDIKANYDWIEAFKYAADIRTATTCSAEPFTIDDVKKVIKAVEGENDGDSWIMIGQLKDGRFFFLDAWCDYTGWG